MIIVSVLSGLVSNALVTYFQCLCLFITQPEFLSKWFQFYYDFQLELLLNFLYYSKLNYKLSKLNLSVCVSDALALTSI